MRPYKLKHIPTGLYYQPHKHGGSNLSKKGKIYQTATHGLSSEYTYARKYNDLETRIVRLYIAEDGQIHKTLKDKYPLRPTRSYRQLVFETLLKDWIIEEI